MNRCLALFLVVCATLMAGCGAERPMPESAGVDIDAEIAKAKKPMVLLIGEFGPGGADANARSLLNDPAIKSKADGIELLTIDLSISSNRAMAARYHTARTPVLVCLSSMGVIASRDEGPLTASLVANQIAALRTSAPDLDDKRKNLQEAIEARAKANPESATRDLAEFLLDQKNDREAIPYLTLVAGDESRSVPIRIDAWVALARAHLWIGEPEKARHAAKELLATMGPAHPDAVAGGNLVLGLQDATAKRFALARQEFESAIYASPASDYGKQAAAELAKLPKDTQ